MSKIKGFVKHAFNNHPIVFNSVLYGTLFFGAEFSQQIIKRRIMPEEPPPIDTATLARFAIYGTTIQGPLLTLWYRMLDRKIVGTSLKIVSKKIFLDQFIMTPPLYFVFFTAMSIMEGKDDIFEELKHKFVPAFKISCFFWIPVQAINFMLVTPPFRVAYVGTCAFAWVNILCWIKHQKY